MSKSKTLFQIGNFKLARQKSEPKAKTPTRRAVDLIIEQNRARAKKDIENWRRALNTAERYPNPRRYLLMDVYRELVIDANLSGQMEQRKAKTIQSRFYVYDKAGKADADLSDLLRKPWFLRFLNYMLDARYYGHSLLQIDGVTPLQGNKGGITDVTLIPRKHVSPTEGLILANPHDQKGNNYRDNRELDAWIIESPDYHELGLLNQTAPHVLYKRFAQAAWSQFSELFGMPLRVGKTNTSNTAMVRDMENMLANMGSAFWAVIDDQEEIEFIDTTSSKGEVFENLIKLCNNEVSKLITGAVIGNESQGGSRSKEEVGERMASHIIQGDKTYIENIINTRLIPLLIRHGYPLEGCSFAWHDEPDLEKLWKNTYEALQYYNVDPEWVKETFGIPVTGEKVNRGPQLSLDQTDFFE